MPRLALRRWPRRALQWLVQGYRYTLSPWLGNRCRFEPSCSAYALQALEAHGALQGSMLTAGRILRCQPWCAGGHDPVPLSVQWPSRGLFTRWMPSGGSATSDTPPPIRKLP